MEIIRQENKILVKGIDPTLRYPWKQQTRKGDQWWGGLVDTYDWPGPFKPMRHQIETSDFMVFHKRGLVLDDTGTGKTLATCWSIDRLMHMGLVQNVLILSPKSTLEVVWYRALWSVFLDRVTIGIKDPEARICVANPAWLAKVSYPLWDMIVVDEATCAKNSATQFWKKLNRLSEGKRLMLMTATPTSQGPQDAHGLGRLIGSIQANKNVWRSTVMLQVGPWKWVPRKNAHEIVSRHLVPSIRHRKADCIDLPPLVVESRLIALTPEQQKLIKTVLDQLTLQLDQGLKITMAHEASARQKLLQILCGFVYDEDHTVHKIPCSRMSVVKELIDETPDPVLVFFPFVGVADLVDIGYPYGVITGDTPMSERLALIDRFQAGELKVLFAHPKTIGHGVTLTKGSTVIWYSPVDSSELYYQGVSRLHRQGQTTKVTVFHLESHPVEGEMYRRLQMREEMQNVLLDMLTKEGSWKNG